MSIPIVSSFAAAATTAAALTSTVLPLLVGSVLRGGLLLAAGLAAWLVLRQRISAAASHLLLTTTLLGLLVLPLLALIVPSWSIRCLPAPAQTAHLRAVAAATVRPYTGAISKLDRMPPFVPSVSRVRTIAAVRRRLTTMTTMTTMRIPKSSPGPAIPRTGVAAAAALFVWAAGTLIYLAGGVAGRLRLRRIAGRCPVVTDGLIRDLVSNLARQAGAPRPITLRQATSVEPAYVVPMTWGWRCPTLLLPSAATLSDWPEERLRAAILHEMAHVARCDWLTQTLAQIVCALHWCDPLAWILVRQIAGEAERACDDRVLLCGVRAPDYASHLLAIVQGLRASSRPAFAVPGAQAMASRRSPIHVRILSILAPNRHRTWADRRLALVAAGISALAIVPLAAVRLSARVQPSSRRRSPAPRVIESSVPMRSVLSVQNLARYTVSMVSDAGATDSAAPPATAATTASLAAEAGLQPPTAPAVPVEAAPPAVTMVPAAPSIPAQPSIPAPPVIPATPAIPVAPRPIVRQVPIRSLVPIAVVRPMIAEAVQKSLMLAADGDPSADAASAEARRDAEQAMQEAQKEQQEALKDQEEALKEQQKDLAESDREQQETAHDSVSSEHQQDITIGESATVYIASNSCNVVVLSGPAGTVHIGERLRGHSHEELEKVPLSVTSDKGGVHITLTRPDDAHSRKIWAQLTITAPADAHIDLATGGGNIRVSGAFSRGLKATTGGGQIAVHDVAGGLELNSGGGNIDVQAAAGAIHANTGGGAVSIHGDLSGEEVIRTGGGPVQITSTGDTAVRLDAETGGGPVSISARLHEENVVQTGGGPILITLPPDSDLSVDATAPSGPISSDFPLPIQRNGGVSTSKGAIGAGTGGRLTITSGGGPIMLHKKG